MLAPLGHHRSPAFDIVCPVVGAANLIFVDAAERHLNQLSIPAVFVEDRVGDLAHAMVDQAAFEAHSLQRHVGSLAVSAGSHRQLWVDRSLSNQAAIAISCLSTG